MLDDTDTEAKAAPAMGRSDSPFLIWWRLVNAALADLGADECRLAEAEYWSEKRCSPTAAAAGILAERNRAQARAAIAAHEGINNGRAM